MIRPRGRDWVSERGEWGFAGDPLAFGGLVSRLFEETEVRPRDHRAWRLLGISYDHVEARCATRPIEHEIVRDVFARYANGGIRLAMVAGLHCFTDEAMALAEPLHVHLYCVRRSDPGYEPIRVA